MEVKILLWKYHKNPVWYRDIVSKAIVYFTGQPYTHAGVYFDGKTYDSTAWKDEDGHLVTGVRETKGQLGCDVVLVPDKPFTDHTMWHIDMALRNRVSWDRMYNFFKLVIMAIIYPTRWFWKQIRWVPFDKDIYGEVCSGFVDEVFKEAGVDLIPHEYEGYTSPGDLLTLPGWHIV